MADYYDMLMDPSGGNELYQNPMMNWGWIGTDIGLALFGGKMGRKMGGWTSTSIYKGAMAEEIRQLRQMRKTAANYDDIRTKPRAGFHAPETIGPTSRQRYIKESRVSIRKSVTKRAHELGRESRKMWRNTGKMLGRMGLFTAAVSFADLGLSASLAMMAPGVSRETIQLDREKVFGDEMLDTRAAYTMRQRSMQAIHDSQMSVGRALIGQESSYLHR